MDLASIFSAMPNTDQLDALSEAWHWSNAPGIDFVAALSGEGKNVFLSHALDSYDQDLLAAVLSFAREHETESITPADRPLGVVEGFSHPDRAFDILVVIGPKVHKYYDDKPELHTSTRAVFPAYRCEFAGDESEVEAQTRYVRASGVRVMRLNREPHPYLKMRHRTESGREIAQRGFAAPKTLVHELRTLENRPDRFVEFENYRHEVWRIEWDNGTWTVDNDESRRLPFDDLLAYVKSSLYGPNLTAGTSQFPEPA